MTPLHPSEALFERGNAPAALPVCDHYAGSEKLILDSLALQARLGPVFDVTADCEAGAEVGREREHAAMIARVARSSDNRFGRLGVRIHDPDHRLWHLVLEELIRAAGERIAYVTVPKVDDAESVEKVVLAIDDLAAQNAVRRVIPVHVVIETHGALAQVALIAAHPRVECVAFGLMDYVSGFSGAVGDSAMTTPGQFEHPLIRRAKVEISVAAHSSGKVPAHNVCVDAGDPEAAGRDARRAAADYGFTRMSSIHPDQVGPIVAALTPSAEEIGRASEILLAARAANWDPIRHAGRPHDRARYRYWWGLLRRAHAAGATLPDDARLAFFD